MPAIPLTRRFILLCLPLIVGSTFTAAEGQTQTRAAAAPIEADTVKVGKTARRTRGLVKELSQGDMACYMTLADAAGREFTEFADFEICSQEPSLIGQTVRLTYKMSRVLAASCRGNMDCGKTDRVALVVAASVIATSVPGAVSAVSAAGAVR